MTNSASQARTISSKEGVLFGKRTGLVRQRGRRWTQKKGLKSTRKICSGRKKNNGTTARKSDKNSKNRIRRSGKKRTTCSKKEMCGTMHGGEPDRMNHTVMVEEKSVHREEGREEQEGDGHQESERTERQSGRRRHHQSWEWRE